VKTKNKTGIICGSFDLMHAGYIRMFKDAKANACDRLVVALQTDPTLDRPEKNKCIQPADHRVEILRSIKYVDDVFLYDTEESLYNLLRRTDYDVRILGTDYKDREYTGKDLDPEVYYHLRDHDISTTKIKNQIYSAVKNKKRADKTASIADLHMRDYHTSRNLRNEELA
jgi:glycerol-3-phosphate cytidylyltransferase